MTLSLRILGMIDTAKPRDNLMCQIWFKNSNETHLSPLRYDMISNRFPENALVPFLFTCKIPKNEKEKVSPESVSVIVDTEAQVTNNLIVKYNDQETGKKNKNGSFAVCIKGLNILDDSSQELAEWLIILKQLGADKVFIYIHAIHPNILKVFIFIFYTFPEIEFFKVGSVH